MSNDPSASTFPPGDKAPATPPQFTFPQRESATYSRRNTAADGSRRHSVDGSSGGSGQRPSSGSTPGQGSGESDRFHPYCRQYSDGGVASCVPPISQSYIRLREGPSPLSFPGSPTTTTTTTTSTTSSHSHRGDQASWDLYNGSFQSSRLMASPQPYSDPPAAPEEPDSFLSPGQASYYSSLTPFQQFSPGEYSTSEQAGSSPYSLQTCLSTPALHDSGTQSMFPKPIYSYSILIFMALKNSKTGSLPVSEIYSFMTENFPYFKTAPDGWKNSVRHNLSLNKCFEKVESKSGNSSRKGCLWALNPAKVEKMQEELHKWRRKDPLAIRKSMARPEDLDRLLGERPDKLKPLSAYHSQNSPLSRYSSNFNRCPSSVAPPRPREHFPLFPRPLHPHVSPPSLATGQQPHHYLHPTAPHPHPFAFFSPCGQQPSSGVPSAMGSLDSPLAGQTPPASCTALQAEYGVGPRGMQELLLEGDASNDIDTLNPSLTDLQLHGNLWEELREDSLAPDSLVVISSSHSSSSPLPTYFFQGCSPRATGPVNKPSEGIAIGRNKGDEEEENGLGGGLDHQMNGFFPTAYPGVENLSMYHTSTGITPIPLL